MLEKQSEDLKKLAIRHKAEEKASLSATIVWNMCLCCEKLHVFICVLIVLSGVRPNSSKEYVSGESSLACLHTLYADVYKVIDRKLYHVNPLGHLIETGLSMCGSSMVLYDSIICHAAEPVVNTPTGQAVDAARGVKYSDAYLEFLKSKGEQDMSGLERGHERGHEREQPQLTPPQTQNQENLSVCRLDSGLAAL